MELDQERPQGIWLHQDYLVWLKISCRAEAAAWVPMLLGSDKHSWERVIFAFGQNGHLPMLAHRIPTDKPRLSRTTYLMAISSFLPQPERHGQLLALLQSWPHEVLSSISEIAIASMQSHLSLTPEKPLLDLQRCLALLHQLLVSSRMTPCGHADVPPILQHVQCTAVD
jgi:hypothetical protein